MFDQVVLSGSAQVCTVLELTRLSQALRPTPTGQCGYAGSYGAGIVFWIVVSIVALLAIARLGRRASGH
jgi:hypothetical protein